MRRKGNREQRGREIKTKKVGMETDKEKTGRINKMKDMESDRNRVERSRDKEKIKTGMNG